MRPVRDDASALEGGDQHFEPRADPGEETLLGEDGRAAVRTASTTVSATSSGLSASGKAPAGSAPPDRLGAAGTAGTVLIRCQDGGAHRPGAEQRGAQSRAARLQRCRQHSVSATTACFEAPWGPHPGPVVRPW